MTDEVKDNTPKEVVDESLSGDEGHDEPAPPLSEQPEPPKHSDEPLPVDNAEEVALSGDGSPQPIVTPIATPPASSDDASAKGGDSPTTDNANGPTVADVAEGKVARPSAMLPVAVIIAILVALVLVALSYAVFIASDEDTNKQADNNTDASQQESNNEQATPLNNSEELQTEVDAMSTDLEGSVDDDDFDASDITDEALEIQ